MIINTLVYYAQRQNNIAYNALYQKFFRLIYKNCYKHYYVIKLNFWFKESIESIAQELLRKTIFEYNFSSSASFSTFLLLKIKYYFSEKWRQAFTNKMIVNSFAIPNDYNNSQDHLLLCSDYDPHKHIIKKDLAKKFLQILNRLETKIIVLWLQGYTYKEIGTKYYKEVKWVDNKVMAILRKLRQYKNTKFGEIKHL